MSTRQKILLLDDEQDLLELYREVLSTLPQQPEIHISNSGARALALLESEPFDLLISDLRMPKMDGLQVLSIVRRKFPHLRLVVMTGVTDEHYRSRAYAMGVDLFWEKPQNDEEIKLFKECIASLLGKGEEEGGFRGVQSKGLVDIIQLECLSQSSSVLKITNRGLEGKIWILNGEVIDAATRDLAGEAAFNEIFSWRAGHFEILPAETGRARTIMESYHSLLLNTAQAMDEAIGGEAPQSEAAPADLPSTSRLARLARIRGIEFLLVVSADETRPVESWGLENADAMTVWLRETQRQFSAIGQKMLFGDLGCSEGIGLQRHVGFAVVNDELLCAGLERTLEKAQVSEKMKQILSKWVS